ncbi:ABC-2 type transport system permease protein [Anaerotaenia torta]|uniref:ABC transporter permease n=1 Tax=Anaerotaenia torta TaxID=433293 RepID=UPI003D193C40
MNNSFARLGTYLRFICRRERISSVIWIICIAGFAAIFAGIYPGLLPGQAEIVQMAATMSNPAMVAMMGNVYGMENLTQASVMAQECLVWFLITAAVMNIFLINRHTRVDEELGRLEIFRALPVGRLTGSLAAIKFAFGVNLLISIFTAALLLAVNIGGTTVSGVFAYGVAIGVVGFVFAGLTLLGAQLFSTAHGVSGFSFALLGLFYIMRALGDVSSNALSWISPLGLGLKVEAFYSDALMPLIILLLEGVVLTVTALLIGAMRDHGAGVLPARKGRARASRFLLSPLGFAWRVSRGSVLGWAAAVFLLGASYGSVCTNINDFVENNEMMKKILGAEGRTTLLDNYIAMIFLIMSIVASIPAVMTAIRIHSEEKRGRLEQIFARSVPRGKLYTSFLAVSVAESIVLELLMTLGLSISSGGELTVGSLLKTGFNYLPAIWTMMGIAALLAGFMPKLTSLVWAVFGYTFIVMYFGRIMNMPEWASRITPFGNIPQLPVQEFSAAPLIILTLLAAAFTVIGVWRFRERDIG